MKKETKRRLCDLNLMDRFLYPFHYYYDNDWSIPLNEGGNRIFLNTSGSDSEGASDELIELLRYFENTTAEVSAQCKSEKIHEIAGKDSQNQVQREDGGEIHAGMGRKDYKKKRSALKPVSRKGAGFTGRMQ